MKSKGMRRYAIKLNIHALVHVMLSYFLWLGADAPLSLLGVQGCRKQIKSGEAIAICGWGGGGLAYHIIIVRAEVAADATALIIAQN